MSSSESSSGNKKERDVTEVAVVVEVAQKKVAEEDEDDEEEVVEVVEGGEVDNSARDQSGKRENDPYDLPKQFKLFQVEVTNSELKIREPCSSSSSSSSLSSTASTSRGDLERNITKVIIRTDSVSEEKDDSCTCGSSEDLDEGSSLKTCTCTNEDLCSEVSSSESPDSSATFSTVDSKEAGQLEYTLAMIKPDAMVYRKEIEQDIADEGFNICQRRWLKMSPEQVSDLYFDNYKEKQFAHLVTYMSSAPILVFILSKRNAIKEWRFLMGPTKIKNAKAYAPDSIRAKYGMKGEVMKNVVHGSADAVAAEREINFFFPDCVKDPVLTPADAVEYLKEYVNEPLSDALIKCCKERPFDTITWLGNYLLENNKKKPTYL